MAGRPGAGRPRQEARPAAADGHELAPVRRPAARRLRAVEPARRAASRRRAARARLLHPVLPAAGRGRQREGHLRARRVRLRAPSRRRSTRPGTRARRRRSPPRCRRSPTPTSCRSCCRTSTSRSPPSRPSRGAACSAQLLISLLPVRPAHRPVRASSRGARPAAARRASGSSSAGRRPSACEAGSTRTTFDDVAGIDEAEDELEEIVDFLREPEKYQRARREDPARRAADRARRARARRCSPARWPARPSVPFFSASAAEFIEMIVGVGASRVRDLFEQAKKAAPAIIFIDELDAIGRARGGSQASAAATTSASRRSTRSSPRWTASTRRSASSCSRRPTAPRCWTRRCCAPGASTAASSCRPPDKDGPREDPRGPHPLGAARRRRRPRRDRRDARRAWSAPTSPTSSTRPRCSPRAAGTTSVANEDFTDALEKIILGAERKIVMSDSERERTAYHEAGHALRGHAHAGRRPRAQDLDHPARPGARRDALRLPRPTASTTTRPTCASKILVALGGRVAEEVVYGTITTGAESDIQQLTADRARHGHALGDERGDRARSPSTAPTGRTRCCPGASETSEATQQLIDARGAPHRRRGAPRRRRCCSAEHRDQLESLTRALLEHETLDEAEAYEAAGVDRHAVAPAA